MFADITLAARIDRAEARLCAGVVAVLTNGPRAGLVLPLAGGQAVFVARGSPVNKVIGLGFEAGLDEEELCAVEAAWQKLGEPVRVELSALTDPKIAQTLSARGYNLQGFENVLARSLVEIEEATASRRITTVPVTSAEELRQWKEISVVAFTTLDGTGSVVDDALEREQMEAVLTDMTSAPGFRRYLAIMGGRAVGSASMRIDDGLAQMCGAGTLPDARGRGVQKALLQARLVEAHAAGCELAVVITAPGSRSQENMMRRGFDLLYARAVMIKSWE